MYRRLVFMATALTFIVVVVGAYVRLADAGLGCPDWPGCYGKLTPIGAKDYIARAVEEQGGTHGPVSLPKAWKEMGHRYLAGLLGLAIFAIVWLAWARRRALGQSPGLPTAIAAVVIVQATLGMWTVTLLLKPVIVTLHLLGGMTILALLTWLALRELRLAPPAPAVRIGSLRRLATIGLVLLALQIALGGWVSTNYAALACTDFPTCHGAWIPKMDFANAFHVVRELGMTPDGDLLSTEALTAIHWMHRMGAYVVAAYTLYLAYRLLAVRSMSLLGWGLAAAVCLQFSLGLLNVMLSLPLPLAAAHNAGAALLLVVYVVVNYQTRLGPVQTGPKP